MVRHSLEGCSRMELKDMVSKHMSHETERLQSMTQRDRLLEMKGLYIVMSDEVERY